MDYNDFIFDVDGVSLTPIPEPAAVLLLATGLIAVGAARRRRRASFRDH